MGMCEGEIGTGCEGLEGWGCRSLLQMVRGEV